MTPVSPSSYYSTLGYGVYTTLPRLPAGWAWIQKNNDWLFVRDDLGRFWFVDFLADGAVLLRRKRIAGLWDWIRSGFAIRVGTRYCDDRYTMFLPKA